MAQVADAIQGKAFARSRSGVINFDESLRLGSLFTPYYDGSLRLGSLFTPYYDESLRLGWLYPPYSMEAGFYVIVVTSQLIYTITIDFNIFLNTK